VLVEVWSDVVCPWCYIGKRRFEAALAAFDRRDEVQVLYRAYQLDPGAPPGAATPVIDAYARKFGGPERAAQIIEHVSAVAATVGLEFRMDRSVRANTLLAHRLLWFAEPRGVQHELKERLLRAYFVDGLHVGDPEVLRDLGAEVGLDPAEVERFLAGHDGVHEVHEQMARATELGITGVPTFVVGGRFSIPGAQEPDVFVNVLGRLLDRVS
jgi:predicted DsbA family dithiol-disulfide isomerase